MPKLLTLALGALLLPSPLTAQKFDGLAPTPPMGWNSWNHFGCDVDEQVIRETAAAMVASGMRDAGYVYVNIDDCWHGERDADGFIHPDPERFPSGIEALAEHVHGLGLRLGIYSDAGAKTCGGRSGSRGHEYQDALTYARWGIDYLKYDWCDTAGLNAAEAYRTMRDALFAAGRPIVFSLCEWGDNEPWSWGKPIGHLWRTSGDITACWDCEVDHGSWSSWGILRILDLQQGLRVHAGPDHWNDPDMMEVGNGMSLAEDRAHFTMWAMLAAPLIAGNDLRTMSDATRAILTHAPVIAIDQDSLGIQGFRHAVRGALELWFRPLADDAWALAILNRGDAAQQLELDFPAEAVRDDLSDRATNFRASVYSLTDLWSGRSLATTRQPLVAEIAAHDVLLVRLDKLAIQDPPQ